MLSRTGSAPHNFKLKRSISSVISVLLGLPEYISHEDIKDYATGRAAYIISTATRDSTSLTFLSRIIIAPIGRAIHTFAYLPNSFEWSSLMRFCWRKCCLRRIGIEVKEGSGEGTELAKKCGFIMCVMVSSSIDKEEREFSCEMMWCWMPKLLEVLPSAAVVPPSR
ncbi:hypothetical protein BDD12DRAFT_854415 [Trichophaea hybrida]|nr:hypothetical protein BDD12DRAFT_854415 [Trichophaea hybrida]